MHILSYIVGHAHSPLRAQGGTALLDKHNWNSLKRTLLNKGHIVTRDIVYYPTPQQRTSPLIKRTSLSVPCNDDGIQALQGFHYTCTQLLITIVVLIIRQYNSNNDNTYTNNSSWPIKACTTMIIKINYSNYHKVHIYESRVMTACAITE